MSDTSATAQIIFDSDPQALEAALNRVERKMGSTESAVSSAARSLQTMVAGYVSWAGVIELLDLARHGEEIQEVRRGFEALAGGSEQAAKALEQGRVATQNSVDDLELMRTIMKGLKQELDFSVILQALKFAQLQADTGAGEFEDVYGRVTNALFALNHGNTEATRGLREFGVSGKSAAEVLAVMAKRTADLDTATGNASDTVDQFDANLKNLKDTTAEYVRDGLAPLLASLSVLINLNDKDSIIGKLGQIQDEFSKSSRQGLGFLDTLPEDVLEAKSALTDLFETVRKGGDPIQALMKAEEALLLIEGTSLTLTEERAVKLRDLIDQVHALITVQKESAAVEIIPPKTPVAVDPAVAAAAAKAADEKLRTELQNARDIKKLEIDLNQATYAELDQLLADQQAKHGEFLTRDIEAKKAWMADSAIVYKQDSKNKQDAESEKYNGTRRFIGYILEDQQRSNQQRLVDAIKFIDDSLAAEQFNLEQRHVLYAQRADLERELTALVTDQYALQIQFLEQTFGTTAQQILADFFNGTLRSFEDYLKQLLAMLAKYALQATLSKLFLSIATGGLLGGLFGGGFMGGGGILGGYVPMTPFNPTGFLNSLPQVNGSIPFGTQAPRISNTVNPTPVQVTLHLDKLGLYSTVEDGRKLYNKSAAQPK